MGLYLKNGFLDFDDIEKTANQNKINFIIIIGKRQVGKTYGALDLMLRKNRYFVLLRRTADEMRFIAIDVNNPFEKIDNTIKVESDSKYTAKITREDGERIGSVMALSTIAKIRGFDGSRYTDIVYDECIPENHVIKLRNEGDAFLNAYTTISGNREIEGLKPLRCWLLANSNDLSAPILSALKVTDIIERMSNANQTMAIFRDRGIMVILPQSADITDKRSKIALYRAIGTESDFAKMSLNNKFSYNDTSDVCRIDLKQYKLIARIDGLFTVWIHKSEENAYIGDAGLKGGPHRMFSDTEVGRRNFKLTFSDARALYLSGGIKFQNVNVKTLFLDFIFV